MSLSRRRAWWGFGFTLPALAFFSVFAFYPMIRAIMISLSEYPVIGLPRYVGLKSYEDLLQDPRFFVAMVNSLRFVVGYAVPTWILALGLALALQQSLRSWRIYQLLYFLPVVMPSAAAAIVWQLILHRNGLANSALGTNLPWLTSRALAPWSVAFVSVWQSVGLYMVALKAGLDQIPRTLYEAARVDGATGWRQFGWITLPLLRPTMLLVMVVSMIAGFETFTYQFVLTKGGPNDATNVISLYIYENAFLFLKMGRAAAASMVMFAIIMGLTLLQFRVLRMGEASFE